MTVSELAEKLVKLNPNLELQVVVLGPENKYYYTWISDIEIDKECDLVVFKI